MDLKIPDEVAQFAASARQALADPNLQRARAVAAGTAKPDELLGIIDALGIREVGCGSDPVGGLAAAHFALEAGRNATPLPVAAILTAIAAEREGTLYAVGAGGGVRLLNLFDVCRPAAAVDMDGQTFVVGDVVVGHRPERMLAPFGCLVHVAEDGTPGDARLWALHEIFTAFYNLGAIDSAVNLTCDYAKLRHQFGRPLASFQGIQTRVADAARMRAGLWELCHYTIWRFFSHPASAIADALALRAYCLEATAECFRHSHQVHGAIGFTNEHDLSVLSLAVQVSRYTPLREPATLRHLAARLDQLGGLFPITPIVKDSAAR